MKIKNEDALDDFVICHKCFTLHHKMRLKDGAKASCSSCGSVMYHYDKKLIDHGLSVSMAGLIFWAVANFFPLVKIELLGHPQFITITKTFQSLFENGFYLVGLLCFFLIFLFPLMIFSINMVLFTLLKFKKGKKMTKELLILLGYIKPWSMSDIFLVSILIALVKLIGYAEIEMGISFWGLIIFVLIDIYLSKRIHVLEIWTVRKEIFEEKKRRE